MSLSWITVSPTAPPVPPIRSADDEVFQKFKSVTSNLASFTAVHGSLYLSTYRVVFIEAPKSKEVMESIPLKQLSIPLHRWIQPTIGQPWFGPNYYEGEVRPTPGGGLQLGGGIILRAKFIFNEGGIERFHKALEAAFATARERQRLRGSTSVEDEPLPLYEDNGQGSGVPPQYA